MLVELLIVHACSKADEYRACAKALEAATIQTRVKRDVDSLEKMVVKEMTELATDYTGKDVLTVAVVVAGAAKERAVTYPIRRKSDGMVPSVIPTLGVNQASIRLGWRF